MAQQPLVGQGFLIFEDSRSHSDTPHSVTPLNDWSARRSDLYLTTHNTHKRLHAAGGIRTHDPSKRAAKDREATGIGWNKYYRPNIGAVDDRVLSLVRHM